MTQTPSYAPEAGRSAAFLAYCLYLLSIPSAGVFALIGVIVAYVGRGEATGAARTHIEYQIRTWWTAFWWTIAIWIVGAIGWVLTFVIIGFFFLMLAALASFILLVWFTAKSFFGLLALLDGRSR